MLNSINSHDVFRKTHQTNYIFSEKSTSLVNRCIRSGLITSDFGLTFDLIPHDVGVIKL